jgi:hypothetical protein
MRARICIWATLIFVLSFPFQASAQTPPKEAVSPVRIELRMEVATTNEDGSPQALRFTLADFGNSGIDLPTPAIDCDGRTGSIVVHSKVIAQQDEHFVAMRSHGCAASVVAGRVSLLAEIRQSWFHLQPGEFLVFTGDGRRMLDKADGLHTYEYWAEYKPPSVTQQHKAQAEHAGFAVPGEAVTSVHLTYSERWPAD